MTAKEKKPVMDVSKPGKSPADATARPIITGHAIMKDPMVNEEPASMEGVTEEVTTPEVTEEKVTAVPSTSHKVIQPLASTEEKADEPAEKSKDDSEKTDEPAEDDKKEAPVSDDAVVDAVLDQVGDKKEEIKQSEEDRKRQEAVDKLIEEKKYFVPIAQEGKSRKNKLALLVIGALLPVIVGLGLAADAGIIDPGFKVPFDFIKDKQATTTPTTQTSTATEPKTNSNPLVIIDTSADSTTKDYMDTAKVYSLKYPSNWTSELVEAGCDNCSIPDYTKVSQPVNFKYPNIEDFTGVTIQADTTDELANSILANWSNGKHTPVKKVINGYSAQYVQVVFKGDAESYTDENYLITKNGTSVFVTFRQKYYHLDPAENWDASKAVPGFETILNSIELLK